MTWIESALLVASVGLSGALGWAFGYFIAVAWDKVRNRRK